MRLSLRTRLLGVLAIVATAATVYVHAQSSTVSYPILPDNVSQWGGAALPAAATLNDAISNPVAPLVGGPQLLWDGTQWLRHKATSLTNFPLATATTARNATGVQLGEKASRWSVFSNPAAGSQATASLAAEASVRHVADCVAFSAASTSAPALTALTINLRDGATGAGTVIWTYQVAISASTGQNVVPHSICGLMLTGTTNTALTLEFSASLANLIESVSISGINVS
jgi:hypothetical protein